MSASRDQSYIVKTFRNNRHYEHDDRSTRGSRSRQENYKASRGRFPRGGSVRQSGLDDDSNMAASGSTRNRFDAARRRGGSRFRSGGGARYANGRGGRGSGPPGAGRQHPGTQFTWYCIQHHYFRQVGSIRIPSDLATVAFGRNYGRDFIVQALNENLPEPFYPIGFQDDTRSRDCSFYVEGQQMSETLMALDQRIATPNGYKMRLTSRRCPPPMIDVDDVVKEDLKLALSSHYEPQMKTLDLSEFHKDTYLRGKGLYLPLHRQPVIAAVVDIIVENIPEVIGIDFSKNRLSTLTSLKPLKNDCKQLKGLNLSCNWLPAVGMLDALTGLPLIELNLDGNKLCDSFKTKADYISAVRKRFSKVVLLDKVELPPPIEFDVDEAASEALPASRSAYFCGTQPRDVALMFLKQYYDVFDSDKRDALMDAYHDKCRFSLSVGPAKSNVDRLQSWLPDSRNLLRVFGDRVPALLRSGKLSVVSALARLPRTQHDSNSFCIDVPIASERLMQVCVSGVLREREERHTPVRAFSRTFVIVPHGQGFCVANEMLLVTQATNEQIKGSFKAAAPTPSPSPIPHIQTVPGPAGAAGAVGADQVRLRMVEAFCQASGMNTEWAAKCLEENGFDYDRSTQVFNQLKLDGKIPPVAFVRT